MIDFNASSKSRILIRTGKVTIIKRIITGYIEIFRIRIYDGH